MKSSNFLATIPAPENEIFEPEVVTTQCPECGEAFHVVEIHFHLYGGAPRVFQTQSEEEAEKEIFIGKRAAIYTIGQLFWVVITLGLAYPFYWVKSLSTNYRITTQRIIIKEGVFSTTTNAIELVRVDEFSLECPWKMRLLGYGILQITSSSPEFSNVYLYGIKDVGGVYEKIRRATRKEQQRSSVGLRKNV